MKILFSFLLILIFNLRLYSQDTLKATLENVIVTATKTESQYLSIASSVTVIDSKEILTSGKSSVAEILRTVPGINVIQQGGLGKLTRVFMRGANSEHTLVIIDGVKVNDPSSPNNAFDFGTMNTYDIDKIEIVRGAQSTLYGSDAIAGVINIITKNGSEKPGYYASIEGGSNTFYKGILSASGSYNSISYNISSTRLSTEGISAANSIYGNSEKDNFITNALTSNIAINIVPQLKIGLQYKFSYSEAGLDQSEKLGDDPNFNYKTEEQLLKFDASAELLNGIWKPQFSASVTKRYSRSLDEPDIVRPNDYLDNYARGNRIKFDFQNNFNLGKMNLLTIGLESQTEKAHTSYNSTSLWGPYESVFPEESMRTLGIYVQNQLNVSNQFFVTAGFRYDDNQKFGNIITYRIAPSYYVSSTNTKLKFTYGTGFKAPSLFYLFDPMFGNRDLKPEKSNGYDFGIEQFFASGKYSFGVNYFSLKLKNMFGFDANYKTVNIAEASSNGLEFFLSLKNVRGLNITSSYTYNKSKDEHSLSSDYNQQLLRRPKHQFSISTYYIFNIDLSVGTEYRFVGERDDKDFSAFPAARVTMPSYSILDLSARYKIFNNISLNARIENLFNKEYEEVLFYGTLKRTFYAGVSYSL
ncbi:MAG: TonB-dependent receptor [Melioribacteraceae bacterium]|jgi:vitamin B12 transporter|nr:TonB-dependent receptor [Melioribacteraceae bacterium]